MWTLPALPDAVVPASSPHASRQDGSAKRTILSSTAVGTAAGLLIGLLLKGASVADDEASVVVTWTAVGLTAGLVGGVVSWLIEK